MDTEALAGAAADATDPSHPTEPAEGFGRYDDDALAAAMADEAQRLGLTGAIAIIFPPSIQVEVPGAPTPVIIAPKPVLNLADSPVPSGQSNVVAAEVLRSPVDGPVMTHRSIRNAEPPSAREVPVPTRRSIRDAEQAVRAETAREEAVRVETARRSGPPPVDHAAPIQTLTAVPTGAPAATVQDAAPTATVQHAEFALTGDVVNTSELRENGVGFATVIDDPALGVALLPDSLVTPTGSDRAEITDDTLPVTISASQPVPAPQPIRAVAERIPVYDLIEPQPYSAALSVVPAAAVAATIEPATIEPATIEPATIEPATIEPAAIGPASVVPATIEPASVLPATIGPATAVPTSLVPPRIAPVSELTDVPSAAPPVPELTTRVSDPADDDGLRAPGTMNPWLQSAAVEVAEVRPARQRVFVPELSGSGPTPLDQRVGRASRLFWLWFAANSSVVSVAFGAAIFSLGMSLRQAVVAVFIGVAISFLPLGLGTLAGKWSGQPVMVVSRATFGHFGNILPATIALISRLFWGAVLLWMIAAATARILVGAGLAGSLTELQLMVIVMAASFLLALIVAFFGYALFARIQLVLSILSAVLIVALGVITWPAVDISTALTVGDGPVILVVTGAVLVFSFVGLVWANSSGDLARYQRPSSSGGAAMLVASFGTTLPAFLLIGYGALLAASNATTARGLSSSPIDTIAAMLPGWYPAPLIAATALSLLSGVILSIYSGGFALGAIGAKVTRSWATVIVGMLVFAVAIALGFTVSNVVVVFRDLATTLAVPVAAWAGIFSAEMILRRRRFDTGSLLERGGLYRDVNWLNLSMLVVASIIGLGFTSATVVGLGWEGYLFTAVGVPLSSPLAATDLGVLISLALGVLTPLVAGIPTIRRQERRQASRT